MGSVPTRVLRWSAQVVVLGAACVALARCGGGGDSGSGPSAASIALSQQTILFEGVAGGANPAAKTVAVTNGGTGSLGGLSSSVSFSASQPDGWLVASLSTSAAPSTLTLTATTGTIVPGSYTSTVAVASSSATNSPRLIDVTFTIGTNVPTTPPSAPTGLTAAAVSSSQINLAWTDNSTNEAGFSVERCDGTTCTNFVELLTVGPNAASYQDINLSASTGFRYRVRAFNGVGYSAYTGSASATTQAPAVVLPAAPTSLGASVVSSTQINLAWTDNSNNETGFRIEGCVGTGCTTFSEFAVVAANVSSHQVITLAASTDYNFRVRAYNDAGNSAYTNSASGLTLMDPPPAPTALLATAFSSTQINLAWTDNSTNESGFRIDRCAGTTCTNFAEIAVVGANITTYQNTALPPSTTYNYRVRAYNPGGTSGFTNSATATTPATPTVPAAPTALSATAYSTTQIDLAWTDNATTETGFKIERCAGTTCTNFVEVATVGPNVTSYANIALTASTAYNYRVRAYNETGNSTYSNSANATTLAVTVNPPAAPTSLTTTAASSSQINLTWVDNATDETGFSIERCVGLSCSNFAEITTVGANVTTYQNTGLVAETGYNYRVRAYNTGGSSAYSNTQATTTLGTAPAAPTVLSATAVSSSQINLSWTDNAANELGFLIERCAGAGCVNFVEFASTTTNVTTYQNTTGLAASTAYTYRVRAWNATGTSGYSNTASATTPAPTVSPPAAPSGLVATATSTTAISLAWTDNSSNEDQFRVEECAGAGCTNFVEIGFTNANVATGNLTGRAPGTLYRYRVRAVNTGGYSAYSNIAQATTETATTFLASFDNMVAKSTADAAVQTTVYPIGENSVGNNYYYTAGTLTNILETASLMKFDVQTQINGKTIVEAQLILFELGPPQDLNGTFQVAAIFSPWNPATITWNLYAAMSRYTGNAVNFTGTSTTTYGQRIFNVTGIVQNWANGTFVNNGFLLFDEAPTIWAYASYQILAFESLEYNSNTARRPQLYIRYR